MAAIVFRLIVLALGLGITEIGLSSAVGGSIGGWLVVLLIGLPLVVAGTAWFMVPLFGAGQPKGRSGNG